MADPITTPAGWAVVTGASSGIGTELARGLARRGHDVLLVARRADRLERLATQLREHGGQVKVAAVDLADPAQLAILLADLAALDVAVLCNNAGLSTIGDVIDGDPAAQLNQIAVNVTALAELTYAIAPRLVARGGGAILMVGSTAGYQPMPGQATYAATKAFVNSLAQALYQELRPRGVTVTLLAPGPVATEFNQVAGLGKSDQRIAAVSLSAADVAEAALAALARGRRVVIPGLLAKFAAAASTVTPTRVVLPLLQRGLAALH